MSDREQDDLDAEMAAALAAMAEEGVPEESAPDLAQDSLALAMGREWEPGSRYVAPWARWVHFDGQRWLFDESLLHMTLTRAFLRGVVESTPGLSGKARMKLLESATIAAVAGLARSNAELVAGVGDWDRDPMLLGTPGGTVDLQTGRLREARRSDFITKSTAVVPADRGTLVPIWGAFLERIFRHDPELIPFIQRAIGYALTGQVAEHVLFFAWGQGGNGKGVLLNSLSRLLGDYATIAPGDLLLWTQSDRHPCDLAMLRGARLVTASELGRGRAWDEPKLKSLTGGDPITARFMRQDFFTYEPQFTLFVAGNNKPSFRGVDEAIRRRVLLLPFLQNIPAEERDPNLPETLKSEWPGILRWAIEGCLIWQRDGLQPPLSVRAATDDYLNAEDLLGQFLEERCIISPRIGWTALATLYTAYKEWCEPRGQHPGSSNALGKKLDERGLERKRTEYGQGFVGIGVVRTNAFGEEVTSGGEPAAEPSAGREWTL
jgi:putative DNA primase/helicase